MAWCCVIYLDEEWYGKPEGLIRDDVCARGLIMILHHQSSNDKVDDENNWNPANRECQLKFYQKFAQQKQGETRSPSKLTCTVVCATVVQLSAVMGDSAEVFVSNLIDFRLLKVTHKHL